MPLDPDVFTDQYLISKTAKSDEVKAERVVRMLAAAVARFESYTGRRVEPTTAASETIVVHGAGPVFRVPDLADLSAIAAIGTTAIVNPATVELVPWGASPTAVYVRLPEAPYGLAGVQLTGQFGMDPIPPDLEDSLYTYAATRWYEATANYSQNANWAQDFPDGATLTYTRRLPTIVRGVWDEYKLPEPAVSSIRLIP